MRLIQVKCNICKEFLLIKDTQIKNPEEWYCDKHKLK